MLDPYARAVTSTLLPEGFHVAASKGGNGAPPANPPALLGSLAPLLDEGLDFSASERPGRALEDIVVLEVDVRTFTAGSPEASKGIPPDHQGKFLGVIDRWLPQYFWFILISVRFFLESIVGCLSYVISSFISSFVGRFGCSLRQMGCLRVWIL